MSGIDWVRLSKQTHKKLLGNLDYYIDNLLKSNQELREQLSNYNKEDEIEKLKRQISEIQKYSVHIMSEKENDDAKVFRDEHYNSCKSNITYTLEGTGIGTAISVKCKGCNTVKNITDVDNW